MSKDFTKKSFSRTIRGYSPDDVDRYLQAINGEYDKLEKHSVENERRLLFALRKLESLTKELQSIYSSADVTEKEPEIEVRQANVIEDEAMIKEKKAELRVLEDELEKTKTELDRAKLETEKLRTAAEERARSILSAARTRGDEIILEAQTKSDTIVAESAKKARAAAEQIITDAALASRKIIRDAETKADEACRDLMTIYGAAEKMYREVSDFRGDMFSLYSNHINSIETITDSANGMIDTVNGIIRGLEGEEIALPEEAAEETEAEETDNYVEPEEIIPEVITEPAEPEEAAENEPDPDQTSIFDGANAGGNDLYITIDDAGDDAEISLSSEPTEEYAAEPEKAEDESEDEDETELAEADNSSRDEEYFDSFDMIPDDEEENVEVDEDESLPWDDEKTDEEIKNDADDADDFDFLDDSSSATNVLDIVKKLGGGVKPQKNGDDDFLNMAALMSEDGISEEEFNKVFNGSKASSDVDEIMRQPLASPAVPTNPKKHSKF